MNERIQELIEQCIDQRWTVTGPSFDKEKFAELIVRECLNVSKDQKKWVEDMESTTFSEQDKSWNKARIQQSQRIIDKIKKYFGVEE